MRIRRRLPIAVAVLLVAAALTVVVELRKHAPPEAARLLPGADGFVYVNLSWARTLHAVGQLPPVTHDPEYQRFIEQTGFQWERDLDDAACAIHYPASWPGGGTAGTAPEPRFSEVFVGKFQIERLRAYLQQLAQSVESYHSVDIFTILLEGRSFRVAILSADSVAASNQDDAAVIRGMIDRSRKLASPFGGPALLRQFYKQVPIASLAWAVLRAEPSEGSWGMLLPRPATLVISARFIRALHLRAEAFTAKPDDARAIADKANVFLALSHSAENAVGTHGTDPDVKAFFDSVQVRQNDDRAVLTAVVSAGFIHKMMTPPSDLSLPESSPAQAPPSPKHP
ncbi:MAG TPA: hypothetical protein VMU61_11450 [Candidatus Aquilonibacter sp.]|nr:hypothetical protein [Candidatus Aquilonibacter sp.]